MRRPAEVKEDVKQMEARMRVSNILNSKAFRDELEQLVTESVEKVSSGVTSIFKRGCCIRCSHGVRFHTLSRFVVGLLVQKD